MTPSQPLVSILIVTWNRAKELARAIDSALNQTYPNIEVVVVDNASTDGTAEMVRSTYSKARLICSHINLGCPSGRNFGHLNCQGKYIYSLDDDGWLAADAIEIAVRRAESDPAIGVVMSSIHETKEGSAPRPRNANLTEPLYIHSFSGGCSLFRNSNLRETGGYPNDFSRQGEEDNLSLRLMDRGAFCFFEPGSIMYHTPSPVGRNHLCFFYYGLRNKMRTGLRLWPFPWNILRVFSVMKYAFKIVLTRGAIHIPFLLFGSLLKECVGLSYRRHPVDRHAFKLFLALKKQPSRTRPEIAR